MVLIRQYFCDDLVRHGETFYFVRRVMFPWSEVGVTLLGSDWHVDTIVG